MSVYYEWIHNSMHNNESNLKALFILGTWISEYLTHSEQENTKFI